MPALLGNKQLDDESIAPYKVVNSVGSGHQFSVRKVTLAWVDAARHRLNAEGLATFARHAEHYARMLAQLDEAIAQNKKRTRRLQDTILHSFPAKLVCLVRQLATDELWDYPTVCSIA